MNSWALIVKKLTEFYRLWIGKPSGYKSSNANQGNKTIIRLPIKWFTNKNDHNLFHNVSSYYHLANEDKLEMPTLSGTAFATPLLIQPTQVIIFQINLEFFVIKAYLEIFLADLQWAHRVWADSCKALHADERERLGTNRYHCWPKWSLKTNDHWLARVGRVREW